MLSRPIHIGRPQLERSLLLQIALLVGFWLAGEGVVRLIGLPLPGGFIGLLAALLLLAGGRLSIACLHRGSRWFVAHMALFFVPVTLAVIDHRELVSVLGLKVLLVIVAGTATVMSVTGLVVELCCRRKAEP
ncbi:MAG: CidA/LrgA family protein [Alphaproteobacteria bacterium]|nr:CidA/LrgA family protein [Alphaproteobacteria bacterium]